MMYALDPHALATLGRSHGVEARLRASVNGSGFVVDLPLRPGGSVAIDGASPVRRKLSCEVQASVDSPTVDPLTAEIRAEYAIVDDTSGAKWWTPVGTFVLVDSVETAPGVIRLTGEDRWRRVVESRFERPVTTSGDTVAAITSLLTAADGRITVDASAAPSGTHGSSIWTRDRDKAVLELARSIGAEVVFDPLGVAVIRRVPSIGDASVWQVGRGNGGTKVYARRGVSRSRTYNAVAVTGLPDGAPPVFASARVTEGRLRYGGPFGKRVRFYTSSLITSQAQAQAVADAMIARVQGVARTLELATAPNPALDAGDVLTVETDPGVWQRHMVAGFTLPLGLGQTPIATRSSTEGDDGGE